MKDLSGSIKKLDRNNLKKKPLEYFKIFLEKYLIFVLIIISVFSSGMAIYLWQYDNGDKDTTSIKQKTEADDLIIQISKFLVLPDDEQPTIATVSDAEILKSQPFFAKAKIGDKVLIYTKAQKAILYDPIANKIVEVAPINLGDKNGM